MVAGSGERTLLRELVSAATSGIGTAMSSGVRTTSVGCRSITQTSTRLPDHVWQAARAHGFLATAVKMADRLNPGGESLPLKLAGDDISRDGSASDSAATPTTEPTTADARRGRIGTLCR